MQALIAPLAAASAATALGSLATGVGALNGIASGVAGYATAKAEKQMAKANAYIGVTRARQTDVAARQSLDAEMAAIKTAYAASGQRLGVGSGDLLRDLRRDAERERRIGVGAEMQRARDFKTTAAAIKPGLSLVGGIGAAAGPLYDLYQIKKRG
jgi:hypothetical protein